jgi:membrane protease YdiL (CAAX protease family)
MATMGTVPWAILVSANIKHWSAVPWAVLPTALYMWLYWRFAKGDGWPQSTREARKNFCRANNLPGEVWGMALFAGALGLMALVLFLNVINRMVSLPDQPTGNLSDIPFITLLLLLIMSAIVAGVAEEVSFRGYMQVPIERRYGPVIAILITGTLFGFAHFTHPEVTLILMPYYIAAATIYGMLAYLTNSILPSLVLHSGGNMLSSLGLFTQGRSEWQATTNKQPLIWETGTDVSFWFSCVTAILMGAVTVWAYRSLRTITLKYKNLLNQSEVCEVKK